MRSWTFCWGINRLCQTAFWHASFCDSSTFFHESWAATVASPTSPCWEIVPLWVGTLSQQPRMITSPKTLLPSELLQIMDGDFRTKQGCQKWTRSWLPQEQQFLHQWISGPRSSPSTFCRREKEDKVSLTVQSSIAQPRGCKLCCCCRTKWALPSSAREDNQTEALWIHWHLKDFKVPKVYIRDWTWHLSCS